MNDRRLHACLDAARRAAPDLGDPALIAVVRAVVAANDWHNDSQHDLIDWHAAPTNPDRPICDLTPVEDIVPGRAVWDDGDDVFRFVAANPPVCLGDDILVTYEEGIITSYSTGDLLPVARNQRDADVWNRQQAWEAGA